MTAAISMPVLTKWLQPINTVAGGIASIRMGSLQDDLLRINAQTAMENAEMEIEARNAEFTRLLGQQRLAYAASGVDITSGSPLLTYMLTQQTQAREQSSIMASAQREAALQRYYGSMASRRGVLGGVSSFLSALTMLHR